MIKIILDFLLGIIILLIALPFMLVTAIILFMIFRSLPIIVQERGITEGKHVFNIYKFKTIKPNIENNPGCNENILNKHHLSDYVPAFCRWLRKSGLDELPQIFNVLKGEMSFIGPRPLIIKDLEILRNKYPEYYIKRHSINVKPGITGLWQVYGDRSKGIENLLRLDIKYNKSASISLDAEILLATIPLVFRGKHSDAIISGITESRKLSPVNDIPIILL
ncbi:MAG: sugar transferase [Ignavibacteriaceae bacterium]